MNSRSCTCTTTESAARKPGFTGRNLLWNVCPGPADALTAWIWPGLARQRGRREMELAHTFIVVAIAATAALGLFCASNMWSSGWRVRRAFIDDAPLAPAVCNGLQSACGQLARQCGCASSCVPRKKDQSRA